MDDKLNFIEPLFEKAEEYGKTSYELFRLKTFDKVSNILSSFILKGIVIFIFSTCLVLLNIGVAIYIGEQLGKLYYGFFCVALFYAIIGSIVFFLMNSWIKKRINNSIISQMFN